MPPKKTPAELFHSWMIKHPDFNGTHNQALLTWLLHSDHMSLDRGLTEVGDYEKLTKLAVQLADETYSYKTQPPPNEEEFNLVRYQAKRRDFGAKLVQYKITGFSRIATPEQVQDELLFYISGHKVPTQQEAIDQLAMYNYIVNPPHEALAPNIQALLTSRKSPGSILIQAAELSPVDSVEAYQALCADALQRYREASQAREELKEARWQGKQAFIQGDGDEGPGRQ